LRPVSQLRKRTGARFRNVGVVVKCKVFDDWKDGRSEKRATITTMFDILLQQDK
jgi:hypothetical protein